MGEAATLKNDPCYGRMNDPTSAAYLKGPCGDALEFYLYIEDQKIKEAKCFTDEGCAATRSCGIATARLAIGRTVDQALNISAGEVMTQVKDLPAAHRHCSILAVSTLYRAIADYLLKP